MTEKTKNPRRKRRTKAEIEADKAAKDAAAKEAEGECIPCQESAMKALEAAEAAVEGEEPAVTEKAEERYVPLTGLAKIRNKYAQRQEIDRSRRL